MTIQVQGSVGGILLVRFKLVGEERSSLRGCGMSMWLETMSILAKKCYPGK
jgi:hypothetical protein